MSSYSCAHAFSQQTLNSIGCTADPMKSAGGLDLTQVLDLGRAVTVMSPPAGDVRAEALRCGKVTRGFSRGPWTKSCEPALVRTPRGHCFLDLMRVATHLLGRWRGEPHLGH